MRLLVWGVVWVAVLVACAAYLWRRLRALGGAAARLGTQLADTEGLLRAVQDRAAGDPQPAAGQPAPLAVFVPVGEALTRRRTLRRRAAAERRARRRARRPAWARTVDWDGPDRERAP